MGARGAARLADTGRRTLPAEKDRPRRVAAGIRALHVSAGSDDARRYVPAPDRRYPHHHHLLRRIPWRFGLWSALSARYLARIRPARRSRTCARLRNQVPGRRRAHECPGHGRRLRNRNREKELMPKMNLSHFEAAVLFALFSSVVLGVITKRTDAERLRYGVRCFVYFMAALIGLGWLMHFGHG